MLPKHSLKLCLLALLLPMSIGLDQAAGQVITGQILGTVRDASGAVITGASVALTSPALTSVLNATSGPNGSFRFPALPPGLYDLQVSLTGFEAYSEKRIRVAVGGAVERNVVLAIAGVEERVKVSAGPLLDGRKPGVSTNYGSDYVENLPQLRSGALGLFKIAPGISATSTTTTYWDTVSAFGSGTNENAYIVDGANQTDLSGLSGGSLSLMLDADIIEEVEILSAGVSAEYGNLQGSVFNVLTRRGGNQWRFDASYYHENRRLTTQPVKLDCNCPAGKTGFFNETHDLSAHLGGALVRDRVWVFGGFQTQRGESHLPGSDPRYPAQLIDDRFSAKLDWRIRPNLKLVQTVQGGRWFVPWQSTESFPFEVGVNFSGRTPTITFADLSYILSENTALDFRAAGAFHSYAADPNSGRRAPYHYDVATGRASDGGFLFGNSWYRGYPVSGKLTHYASDFLAGDHDFKFGIQFKQGLSALTYGYPGGALYYDNAGAPLLAVFGEPHGSAGRVRQAGVFGEDVLRMGERLTLHLGARLDHNQLVSADVPAVDAEGRPTGGTTAGLGTAYAWNVVSPRLGLNLKLSSDGRTLLRASFGRFYQGAFAAEVFRFHPADGPITVAFFDRATGRYSRIASVIDTRQDLLDPDTRPPHTDEFSIGVERQLGRDAVVGVTYVRKDGRDYTGWVDVGGVYGTTTATLQDGRTLTVFPLVSSPAERRFLLTNPDNWFMRYNGLLVTFNKRWSQRWQAMVSYSRSEVVGIQTSTATAISAPQVSVGPFRDFGRDPNDRINAEGNLRDDRTNMFRVQAVAEIPRVGLLVAASFQQLTGKPWAATAVVRLPQGARSVFLEPPGTRRLPSQTLLDVRVSKSLRFKGNRKLELLVDVLNVLNDTASQSVRSTNFFVPNFGELTQPISPLRARIGLKVVF